MPQSVDELVQLLDIEETEHGRFRARQPDSLRQRVFGGQVLGQALVAASSTVVDTRSVHSLHGYFLRPGRPDVGIVYDVESTRDGGSVSSRRVVARQAGSVILNLSASFKAPEDGLEHQDHCPNPVPAPSDCPKLAEVLSPITGRSVAEWEREWGVLDVRYAGDSSPGGTLDPSLSPARARIWVRVGASLPPIPTLHQAALAYLSDLTLLSTATVPHAVDVDAHVQAVSIDHAMWFHRPFRADQWLLYDQVSPSASNGLGLSIARLFQDGQLVSTAAQEGLIRTLVATASTQSH